MSKKWEWIGDPAGILTGFTGDDSQQPGAHLLEFPERKVRALADLTVSLADLIVGLILKFSKHAWGKLIFFCGFIACDGRIMKRFMNARN